MDGDENKGDYRCGNDSHEDLCSDDLPGLDHETQERKAEGDLDKTKAKYVGNNGQKQIYQTYPIGYRVD